ncbi:UPF0481 protein At3g47200 isoform X3 [Vitis vinifera]|uniref:UPF0481 protein At3g47200 isoform X3 n=1 Tax=Vitis vinifera TaxID=29760 RepID=UPI00053F5674|nr:UPF0481 protein At3g47200 isoform X3 [Vitis vinifera]|eukprot:XP_002282552.3 PREDICTED: UPF0481 protein At3g47200 isoform X1 [Vitis vinifera]
MSFQDNNSVGEAGKEGHGEMLKKSSKEVATSLQGMLEKLTPLSTTCCIYRVPQKLRKANMEAYTPRVVSIGPLHHGEEHLVAMEEHKLRYLQKFLSETRKTLEECVEIIYREEEKARGYYMESIKMSREEFVKMILVDACFIIEVILGFSSSHSIETGDRIYNKPRLFIDVRRDMTLLENQLPFFLLLSLYSLRAPPGPLPENQNDYAHYSFLLLSVKFFKDYLQMPEAKSSDEIVTEIKKKISSRHEIKHFVDLLIVCLQPSSSSLPPESKSFKFVIPTATYLREAGVRFKLGSKDKDNDKLLDLDYNNGVLKIPHLILQEKCESLFRNLIAYEECHDHAQTYITDYMYLMDHLINTTKDVNLLVRKGIISNHLGDNHAVKNLFNRLLIDTTTCKETFHFAGIYEKLNKYYDSPWNRWQATLRHDYFSSPWRGASTIAAVILLVLTLIQTVFTWMSVK